MFQPVHTLSNKHKQDKRSVFSLANENPLALELKKLSDMQPLLAKDATLQSSQPDFITGEALTTFTDRKNQIYVQNVTLIDANTKRVFLQRFGPTSQHTAEAMKVKAERGILMFKDVATKSSCSHARRFLSQSKPRPPLPHFLFGAWCDPAQKKLELTADTAQYDNEMGREMVSDYQAWVREYVGDHILPFVNNKEYGLCESFRQTLKDRMLIDSPWAAKQIPGLDILCHPLYTTVSAFQGFSSTPHCDTMDADVSMLMNFGQHALLELPEYGCKVVLQPLDIVFFLSNAVLHCSKPHQAHVDLKSNPADRMVVTCSYSKYLLRETEPITKTLMFLAQQSLDKERQWKRVKKSHREASETKPSAQPIRTSPRTCSRPRLPVPSSSPSLPTATLSSSQ